MKKTSLLFAMILLSIVGICQTSPATNTSNSGQSPFKSSQTQSDTLTFNAYPTSTVITTQYLNQGVLFSGFDGSGPPVIYDYTSMPSYGRTLTSENWFYALKVSFVDTLDTSSYQPVRRIEFDNVVEYNGEVDYIHIDVYDSNDVLIQTSMSQSPEHVVLDFPSPVVAYITIDDSAATAYALDNFLIDGSVPIALDEAAPMETKVFPNPSTGPINIKSSQMIDEIVVFNSIGQRVHQVFPGRNQVQIELEKSGVYFAVIKSEGNINSYKILVAP